MMLAALVWNISVPISSAVSMPSRVIISTVNRNTPANAFAPSLQRRRFETRLDVPLQPLAVPPHVHDQRRDEHRGGQREHAFPERLVAARAETAIAAPMLIRIDTPMPQCTAGHQLLASGLPQIGQRNRDDEEGFEPFAQGDDEAWSMGVP